MKNWEEAVEDMKVKVMRQMGKVQDRELSLTFAAAEIGMMPDEFLACYKTICKELEDREF